MTNLTIPYHKTYLNAQIPDHLSLETIAPKETVPAPDPMQVSIAALANPIGDVALDDFANVQTVAIAVNDKTRPVPHQYLLPPLLEKLEAMGIASENITLVIATGTHPVMPPEEYTWILPESIVERYPIVCHDYSDQASLMHLGETERGTPVYINKHYMQADLRIVVGNIEPHQFMGFSGGVKSASIGVAGKKTINHNHAMMTDENAKLGAYEVNPARQDVEEIGRMIGVHYAHNALLNGKKQIVEVLSGDPYAIMEKAIPRVREIYQVPVDASFDLMIVSPGGYPKDINVYQSQKGLAHAALVTKQGGTIILCAACPEGTGSQTYEQWVTDEKIDSHDAVFHHFSTGGFQVGPHKAFQISRDASQVRVMLISEMQPEFVRQLLLHPLPDLQTALDKALADLPPNARIGVMPSANSTIPMLV